MSHEHKDYLITNLPAMRRVVVDQTQVLNGEGLTLWLVILDNVQTSSLFMSLASLSKATGMDSSNIRKRLAVFVKAGWLIEIGFQKNGKYQATKTYEVVLDVLGVGQVTHSKGGSKGGSHGGSHGGSKGGSKGGSRNIANPTPQEENAPNPITNPIPNPNPTTHEYLHNIDNTPNTEAMEMNTRIDNIVSLCIELERNKTPNIGRGLQVILHRDYTRLAYRELTSREWLTDESVADVCFAKRNGKTPPQCTRPTCTTCFGSNRDIVGLEGLSTICDGDTYVTCPKCDGDGYQPIKAFAQNIFKNLNTKGHTK